jgi:prolyl-tRNA synthetase
MIMYMSALFVPTNKNGPAKVKDPGLVNIVKGGYALYDNHGDALHLLPLGVQLRENLLDVLKETFSVRGVQQIHTGIPEEGALGVASRTLKTEDQLPLLFMEEDRNTLHISGILSDADSLSVWMEDFYVRLHGAFNQLEVPTAVIEEAVYVEGVWEERISLYACAESHVWKGCEGLLCKGCGYAAHSHALIAEDFSEEERGEPQSLTEVHTPGADTIEELCRQLDLSPEETLKTMFFAAEGEENPRVVVALMRGDRKISPLKLAKYLKAPSVRLATPEELHKAMGILGGYLGPQGVPEEVMMVADHSVEGIVNVAVGANKPDYHCTGACWGRDFNTSHVTDLLQLEEGSSCPFCGEPMIRQNWRRIASFGPAPAVRGRYSVNYRDKEHKKHEPQFFNGQVEIEQILLALFENEDSLHLSLAPYVAYLYVTEDLEGEDELLEKGGDFQERVAEILDLEDIPVLVDDCTEKAKNREFNASVLRFPWILRITKEGLAQGKILLSSTEDEDLFLDPEDLVGYYESFVMDVFDVGDYQEDEE